MTAAVAAAQASSIVNEQNPWPGLAPFDEASAPFFNGRERETAELFRLVTGSHLALLFGASGLGKSSLLQAGLFPKLRSAHYLPVYLRLDVADTTRPLIEQVRAALIRELKTHGVDAPEFQEGESLWRYLHRDELEFWSRQTHLLTPVFVFDQFEEILTYRDENPAGAAQFRLDIADLAENRIPPALDASALVGLTLDRRSYKIVLSFREDYTAAFEAWKRDLPSIMRNRYPLTAMDATNALEAVLTTGAAVIERPVAQEIVRYVAGADDKIDEETLATLPVEPALLSVVCSELNRKRLAANPPAPKISSADFKASRDNILKDFYERSLAGTPKQVRKFIEERLLTESGRRNTAPEDDVERAGVPLAVVEQLVDRRLLRREKRLGVTHLELTHDRLTTVVGLSRDARRIRSRRKSLLLAVFGSAMGLMAIFGWLAYQQFQTAKVQQQRALASREHEYERRATMQAMEAQRLTADLNDQLKDALRRADSDAALAKAALSAAQLRSNFRFGLTQVISSPSASVVLTIGEDGRLSVLRGKTASGMSYFIKDPDGPIIAAAISPSEKQIATATASGHIAVWEALSGSKISSFEWSGQISSLSFYSDEAGKLIVASRDGTLRLFNIKTGKMEDSRNAVFAARGCIPFTAQFLAYNPRPLYRASVGFEAQCADGLRDAAPAAERELTPDQVALLVGPVADSAKSVEATLGPRNSKPQVSDPPPAGGTNPTRVASPQTPQNARGQERWRMNFSVWARKNPTDSFGDPLATAQVEFDGGPKSIDIVQRGLNEVQIRIISREVEQLADRLTASSASQKDPGLNALVMTTANAILKELGFPPLPSNR